MRQYTGFASPADTNRRFKYLIAQGQAGLSTAFDLPTQLGYDSDDELAEGEVGRVGVPICTPRNMDDLMQGISLQDVSISMTINSTAHILLAFYLTTALRRQTDPSQLRGTLQNDILKEFAARNTYIYPPEPSLRLAVDIIEYCIKKLPKWYPISISGYHIREAGSNAVQELALTFANAVEYCKACVERGLKFDDFSKRLSFFFACSNDFLEEIAKFRAARRIWAMIARERFGSTNPEASKLRFHVQTSGETLTAQEPQNNVIRVTIQALAAVLGGTQSLHTNSLDEALSLPTEASAKLALRTQQVIAYESAVTKVADPLGGSYLIEYLTDELEERASRLIRRIEREGGALGAIESGMYAREIQESAYLKQKQIETGERKVVGVNIFGGEGQTSVKTHKIDSASVRRQVAHVKDFKRSRDLQKIERVSAKVVKSAEQGVNLVPVTMEAVQAKATLQEISDSLRSVYGTYKQSY
jgi:methylmalonyl-CoA mutase N-terminal domain/subunit